MDRQDVNNVRRMSRLLVKGSLVEERLPRTTLDFAGSVQSTKGYATEFILLNCFANAKQELKGTIFELRMDSAFFNNNINEIANGDGGSLVSVHIEQHVILQVHLLQSLLMHLQFRSLAVDQFQNQVIDDA
jgi:hypothetical protein